MAKNLDADFRDEKNKLQSAALITLYEIELPSSTARITDYDEDVTYNAETYVKFPIKKSDIQQNMFNQITHMQLTIANANRVYGAYLEQYDGLIGRKVTVINVFANLLGDANANITEEFYVKSSQANQQVVILDLSSKLDIMDYHVPKRTFTKNFCQWEYKNRGCWLYEEITGGYTAGANFTGAGYACDRSLDGPSGCEWHTNEERFGAFFSIPEDISILRI